MAEPATVGFAPIMPRMTDEQLGDEWDRIHEGGRS
jgi:hypothetical protein